MPGGLREMPALQGAELVVVDRLSADLCQVLGGVSWESDFASTLPDVEMLLCSIVYPKYFEDDDAVVRNKLQEVREQVMDEIRAVLATFGINSMSQFRATVMRHNLKKNPVTHVGLKVIYNVAVALLATNGDNSILLRFSRKKYEHQTSADFAMKLGDVIFNKDIKDYEVDQRGFIQKVFASLEIINWNDLVEKELLLASLLSKIRNAYGDGGVDDFFIFENCFLPKVSDALLKGVAKCRGKFDNIDRANLQKLHRMYLAGFVYPEGHVLETVASFEAIISDRVKYLIDEFDL